MEFFHLNADSPLWLFLRELVYITNILRELTYFHLRSLLPFRERVRVIVDEITGVIFPQLLHLLLLLCKFIIIEVHLFIIHTFGFHFIHTIGILAIIFGIIFGTIMLLKLLSRAAVAVAKKIGIYKSNGKGEKNITDDYEIVDEPASCEVFPYRNHQSNSFDNSTDDETVKDVDTTDDQNQTGIERKDVDTTDDLNQTEIERIKARFDRDHRTEIEMHRTEIEMIEMGRSTSTKIAFDVADHNSSASTDGGDLERSRMIEMIEMGRTEDEGIVVDTSDEEVISVVSVSSESSRFSNVLRALDYEHLRTSPLFSDLQNDEIFDILDEINGLCSMKSTDVAR